MNKPLLCKLLGLIAMLVGASMVFSLVWAMPIFGGEWEYEREGLVGLVGAMIICFLVGVGLRYLGRNAKGHLFRKEAMAVVGLSWVMATVLGALPFILSGTHCSAGKRMTVVDAMFEAQSGFSTTGATVLTELQDPELVPRCILFWRSSTHFLGGLGIIVLFVAILGQGSAGKAMMQTEMPGPSHSSQQARIQHTAWVLFLLYAVLNVILTILLLLEGLGPFDALCHAFGTMATGGFSTKNASIGYFMTDPSLNGPLIEMTITLFMILAGTNFMLMYFVVLCRPGKMLGDIEWRTYIGILFLATLLVIGFGLYYGNFDGANGMVSNETDKTVKLTADRTVRLSEDGRVDVAPATEESGGEESDGKATLLVPSNSELCVAADGQVGINLPPSVRPQSRPVEKDVGSAVRFSLFQVVSITTTTGFCTDNFDKWNSFSRGLLLLLMFVGGCAGSTGGGLKVIRHILFVKVLGLEMEQAYHPSVVRPLRLGGEPVENRALRKNVLVYFGLIVVIFAASWLFTIAFEPDSTWTDHGHEIEHKLIDAASAVAATLNNIGPGLGVVGATKNYTNFSWWTKTLFIWLMMIGRLEIFAIAVLFVPGFWRTQ